MIPKDCKRLAEVDSRSPRCHGTRRGRSRSGMGMEGGSDEAGGDRAGKVRVRHQYECRASTAEVCAIAILKRRAPALTRDHSWPSPTWLPIQPLLTTPVPRRRLGMSR